MASIRFITAPIGGGKSLFATIEICKEMDRTDRFIVTNIPLILKIANSPERTLNLIRMLSASQMKRDLARWQRDKQQELYWTMAEYCHVFIERPIMVAERLICLTEEQSLQYWRYIPRGNIDEAEAQALGLESFRNESDIRPSYGYMLPNLNHKQYGVVPDFSFRQKFPRGVYYVIDEAHQLFPARGWQTVGPQVERYMSQLRKLNDDLDLLTQHPEKVDKNFRRNATDWLQVENMGKKSMFMGVSLNNRFRFHWFNQAEMPTRFEKPTKSGWYRIDPVRRYQWLYKTAEGVGVSGSMVAEESRHKGRSVLFWLIPILAIPLIAYFLPMLITKTVRKGVEVGAGSLIKGFQQGAASIMPTNLPSVAPVRPRPILRPIPPAFAPGTNVMSVGSPPVAAPAVLSAPAGIYATGYFPFGTNVWVLLSDGSIAKSENGEVQGIGEKFVKVYGWDKIPLK